MEILPGQCKKVSTDVVSIKGMKKTIKRMAELCRQPIGIYDNGGYAIAHCQVDHDNPKRFFVTRGGNVYINPVIIERDEKIGHREGCLSYPDKKERVVKRFNKVKVRYMDLKGRMMEEEATKLWGCIFQHEIDHFDGIAIYK